MNLSEPEVKIRELWKDIIKYVNIDIANIWSDKVKKDFEELKGEVAKIEFVLRQFQEYYHEYKVTAFKKGREDVLSLLTLLKNIEPTEEYARELQQEIMKVIEDYEEAESYYGKNELKSWGFREDQIHFLVSHWDLIERLVQIIGIKERPLLIQDLVRYSRTTTLINIDDFFTLLSKIGNQSQNDAWTTLHLTLTLKDVVEKFGVIPTGIAANKITTHKDAKQRYARIAIWYLMGKYDQIIRRLSNSVEDTYEIMEFMIHNIRSKKDYLFAQDEIVRYSVLSPINSKELFYKKFLQIQNSNDLTEFYCADALYKNGYLCIHSTNAFISPFKRGRDPFTSIAHDIILHADRTILPSLKLEFEKRGIEFSDGINEFFPSTSVISPKSETSFYYKTRPSGIYSFGVLYDYGYAFQTYSGGDQATRSKTGSITKKEIYRGSPKNFRKAWMDIHYTVSYEGSDEPRHNEFILRKWTVSGIFYVKGCSSEVIERLKIISNICSFKPYINGKYWYRKTKIGVPKIIIKVFPIYEIDPETRIWNRTYVPENNSYHIIIDTPNNTHIAILKT